MNHSWTHFPGAHETSRYTTKEHKGIYTGMRKGSNIITLAHKIML